jgi:ABC-type transporter Mla subunit MlaD
MSAKQDDVFNVSVTEILLIIMFSVLVAMVLLNSTLQEEVDAKEKVSKEYALLAEQLQKVNDNLGLTKDATKGANLELNEAVAQMQALVQALKNSVESEEAQQVLAKMKLDDVWTALTRVKDENFDIPGLLSALKDLNNELQDCLAEKNRLIAELAREKKALEKAKTLIAKLQRELEETKNILAKTQQDNANLTGQVENLSNGLEFPPCWATPQGKAQYTYLVTVHDDSLAVTSIYPEIRREDYFTLMKQDFAGDHLSLTDFKRKIAVFYSTAVKSIPECRFFVQVEDATSFNSKAEYKKGLRTVESVFYKYLIK